MFIPNAGKIIINPIEKQQEVGGLLIANQNNVKYGIVDAVSTSVESSQEGKADFVYLGVGMSRGIELRIEPGMMIAYSGNEVTIDKDHVVIDTYQVIYIEIEDEDEGEIEDDVESDDNLIFEDELDNTDVQDL